MTDRALTTTAVSPAVAESIETLQRLQTVRNVLAPDLNDQELQLFAMVAQRSGLDPFAKQIYAIKRGGRVTFQTGIDGFRATAARTNEYGGSDDPEYGPDKNGHPEWARVVVYRIKNETRFGQPATAYWDEFHPGGNQPMWSKMPRNQLAKCAEALALRKAFPYVLADIYTPEEMDQAGPGDDQRAIQAAAQPTARERIAARRQAREDARSDVIEGTVTDACGWKLGQGSKTIDCEMAEGHDGPHSWNDLALSKGGRVIEPTCASVLAGETCIEPAGHEGPHKSEEGVWPQDEATTEALGLGS